jgi:hypothetical protein
MEAGIAASGQSMTNMSLNDLEAEWQSVKRGLAAKSNHEDSKTRRTD